MQPLSSNGQSAVSHLSGYPDAVGVGPLFAIQLTVVYGRFNLSLLTWSFDWDTIPLDACEGGSILVKQL